MGIANISFNISTNILWTEREMMEIEMFVLLEIVILWMKKNI